MHAPTLRYRPSHHHFRTHLTFAFIYGILFREDQQFNMNVVLRVLALAQPTLTVYALDAPSHIGLSIAVVLLGTRV